MADDHNLNGAAAQIERAQVDKCLRPSIAGFFDEATNTVSYVIEILIRINIFYFAGLN